MHFGVQHCTKVLIEDGRDKISLSRDDAAGYRLDIIQVTSYLLIGTKTTPQLSGGIVKPQMIHPKNPAQHMADMYMYMLQKRPDFECRMDSTLIDCIRVDGAIDEGLYIMKSSSW